MCLSVRGPAWLQWISGLQLLATQSPACQSYRRLGPELSALHSPPLPAILGWVPQSLQHDSITLSSLLTDTLHPCTHACTTGSLLSLESHLSSSFKKVSVWPLHCSTEPWGPCSLCTPTPQKA